LGFVCFFDFYFWIRVYVIQPPHTAIEPSALAADNTPNYPNKEAFATLKADSSITAWGSSSYGGTNKGIPMPILLRHI
jgi:hypothetical protein